MIVAPAARELGAAQLTLVCPYLAYMRQDMAFQPGEAVSQRHVGQALAAWFDAVITVDPHLHRVASMDEVLPGRRGLALSAAPLLGAWAARHAQRPILLGPDEEAAPWVRAAAHGAGPGARHLHQAAQRRPRGARGLARHGVPGPRGGADRRCRQHRAHAGRHRGGAVRARRRAPWTWR